MHADGDTRTGPPDPARGSSTETACTATPTSTAATSTLT